MKTVRRSPPRAGPVNVENALEALMDMNLSTLRFPLRRFSRLLLVGLAGLLAAGGSPARGQQASFEGSTEVVEVQVPVNVTTRDGQPVRGLTRDDFQILDQGREQELSGFDVVDLDALKPDMLRGPSSLEAAVPAAARRHFLLLFDLTFSSPASVVKARRAAEKFVLEYLHPTDLAAVATYSIDVGPRLLVTFTPDRAQLARAIDTLGAPKLLDNHAELDPLRFMIDDPATASRSTTFSQGENRQGKFAGVGEQEVQAYIQVIAKQINKWEKTYQRGRISSWAAGLEDVAHALSSVEGRKNVILFSEGFDGRLMLGRGPDPFDPEAEEDRRNLLAGQSQFVDTDDLYGNTALQSQVNDMLRTFQRSDCLIQAVDIGGLGSESAEDRRARTVGQDALFFMANETGGQLFENSNDFGSELEDVLERSTVTYLLSFRPSKIEPDGSFHRLEVKLRGSSVPRGADLAYRAGYFAPRPYQDLHPLEKNLLASDAIASAAPRHDLDVNVLAAPFRAADTRSYLPVIIEVGGDKLMAGNEGGQVSAEFYAYVSNDKGEMKDFFSQRVSLSLTDQGKEQMKESGLKYYGHLLLQPGQYLVRVLVRNTQTGRTGVQSVPVKVPDYGTSQTELLPPFFPEPQGRWFLVREQQGTQKDSVVYPFTVNGSPYIPAAKPVILPGKDNEVVLVAYNLAKGDVDLKGTIVGADGRQVDAGKLSLVERTVTGIGGLDKLVARFSVNDLAGGTYTLNVALQQPGGGLEQQSSIPFSVPN